MLPYLARRGRGVGPLFRTERNEPLTKQAFVSCLKLALGRLGYDGLVFAGHSFRISAATTAAACGFEDSTIKLLGRWASNAFQIYVKTPRTTLAAVSAKLVLQ